MRKKPPCKKDGFPCQVRFPGCQDLCPDFLEWKATEDERKRARDAAKEREYITYSDRVKAAQIKKQREGRK